LASGCLFDFNAEGRRLRQKIGGVFCKVDDVDADVDAGFHGARAALDKRILVNCAGTGNAFKTASRDKQTREIMHFPLAA
jgi:hypothetical protein